MKTIQVRNVPDHVHAALRSRAAGAGVSLSDLALAALKSVAEHPPVAEVLTRARSRSAAGGPTTEMIVEALRSGRDRS